MVGGGSPPPAALAPGPAPPGDMDWSYLVSGYQDGGGFPAFNSFGALDNPMAGLGALGEPDGATMYGGANH
ncbi:hypothetical protein CDD83_2556 [Cordyceps sp. RAO-2017]|nr:hypothetical protein CDD83_2556 [Cordyceps sp. RAO-2017]